MANAIIDYCKQKVAGVKRIIYPITKTKAVYDDNGTRLDNKLTAMQEQLDGVSTEIINTMNSEITKRAGEDIATKEELKNTGGIQLLKNGGFRLNTHGLSEYRSLGETVNGWHFLINYEMQSVTINADKTITIANQGDVDNNGIYQNVGVLKAGNTYTLSVKVNNLTGGICIVYFDMVGSPWEGDRMQLHEGINTLTYTIKTEAEYKVYFSLDSSSEITLEWAKLELGSLATEYIEPDLEIERVRCGVGNADTLDGKHASDMTALVRKCNAVYIPGTDLNTMTDCGFWSLTASSQATLECHFPIANIGGIIEVTGSSSNIRIQTYYAMTGTSNYVRIFYRHWFKNTSTNEEFWSNWDEKLSCLTGGTLTTNTSVPLTLQTTSDVVLTKYIGKDGTIGYLGFSSDVNGVERPMYYMKDGNTGHVLLHTGNSKPVAIQSTAPTDTSALWYNPSTKALKSYVDGAWT